MQRSSKAVSHPVLTRLYFWRPDPLEAPRSRFCGLLRASRSAGKGAFYAHYYCWGLVNSPSRIASWSERILIEPGCTSSKASS